MLSGQLITGCKANPDSYRVGEACVDMGQELLSKAELHQLSQKNTSFTGS